MISSSLFLSFFASIFGVFPEFSSKFPPRFFETFSFSLSFFGAPYFAIAQYGLLSRYCLRAIRALAPAMCSLALRAYAYAVALFRLRGSIRAPLFGANCIPQSIGPYRGVARKIKFKKPAILENIIRHLRAEVETRTDYFQNKHNHGIYESYIIAFKAQGGA